MTLPDFDLCLRPFSQRGRRAVFPVALGTFLLLMSLLMFLDQQSSPPTGGRPGRFALQHNYVTEIDVDQEQLQLNDEDDWQPGTTLRYPDIDTVTPKDNGPFQQPSVTWLTVEEGRDVRLPCRLSLSRLGNARHSLVAWYRGVGGSLGGKNSAVARQLLTLGQWTVSADQRVSIQLQRRDNSWSLLLRRVSRDDSDEYGCYLSGGGGDFGNFAVVILDVVPTKSNAAVFNDSVGIYPWRKALRYRYSKGFNLQTAVSSGSRACGSGPGGHNGTAAPEIVTTVLMGEDDLQKRRDMRQMWGGTLPSSYKLGVNGTSNNDTANILPLVFIINNLSASQKLATDLNKESSDSGDVVLGKFEIDEAIVGDDRNQRLLSRVLLTMKAFEFFKEHCSNANHLLIIDGTKHKKINATAIAGAVKRLMAQIDRPKMAVYGPNLVAGQPTNRNPLLPHYIQHTEFLSDSFPAYVSGGVYLYTALSVESLFERALRRPPLFWPELLFNGVLAEEASVSRRSLAELSGAVDAVEM